jgi:hypothetical protein
MAKSCTSTLELRGKCSRLQKIGENSQRYLKAGLIIRGMTAQRGVSTEECHVEVAQSISIYSFIFQNNPLRTLLGLE